MSRRLACIGACIRVCIWPNLLYYRVSAPNLVLWAKVESSVSDLGGRVLFGYVVRSIVRVS